MAETKITDDNKPTTTNDVFVEVIGENQEDTNSYTKPNHKDIITLYAIFNNFITAIISSQPGSLHFLNRIKTFLNHNIPLLPEASKNTAHHVHLWTRRGSSLRALLVISTGTIGLLALTGLLVFTVFFILATTNAIAISLLITLAATGGFLAIFFACVTAIYIGALTVAVCVISTVTISTIIAAFIVTGWIGFFWMIWVATRKSVSLANRSLGMAGSAVSSYSSSRHARRYSESTKLSD